MPTTLTQGLDAAKYVNQQNPIFLEHNELMLRVLGDLSDAAFLERCYVPRKIKHAADLLELAGEAAGELAKDSLIGEYEADLIKFSNLSDIRQLLVIGPVGSGKTTLLEHWRKYVKRTYPKLFETIDPIKLDFNKHKAEIEKAHRDGGEDATIFVQKYLDTVVTDRIAQVAQNVIAPGNEKFWSFIEKESTAFSRYMPKLRAFRDKYGRDAEETEDLTFKLRTDFSSSTNCLLEFTRYWKEVRGRRIVLIVDNVDPLNIDIHEQLVWLAEWLTGSAAIQMILAMRQSTYQKLDHRLNALRNAKLVIAPPTLREIIAARVSFLLDSLGESDAEIEIIPGNRRSRRSASDAINAMSDILLSDSTIEALEKLCCGDIRLAMKLLAVYFDSTFFHADELAASVAKASGGGIVDSQPPTHVFVQSIVTNNHRTFFQSSKCASIVNVWCDHSDVHPLSHFFKLITLSLIETSEAPCRFGNLYTALFEIFGQDAIFNKYVSATFRSMICELVNDRIIFSPHYLTVDRDKDLNDETHLELSPLGRFYLTDLSYRVEYFSYIKDDISLEGGRGNLKSAIDRPGFTDRVLESVAFCEYLLRQEKSLVLRMKNSPLGRHKFETIFVRRALPSRDGRSRLYSSILAESLSAVCDAHIDRFGQQYKPEAIAREAREVEEKLIHTD